jgi:hypothetical protein
VTTLFESYLNYVDKTEPPIVFHRWSLLSCLGAQLGRQFWFPFGDFRIMPNMYVMLIGDPGTRKSTAIKLAKKMLAATGYDKFSGDRTSKEKFLLDLEGIEDEDGKVLDAGGVMSSLFGEDAISDPKEVFVCADEFNDFVGSGNLEFLSLLGSLWDWDDVTRPFKQRLKTTRSVSIYQPTISILAGNTHAGFTEAFPPAAMGQGFLSRLLLIYGESSGVKIAFPEKPNDALRNIVVEQLTEIKEKVHGEATMTSQARGMLQTIYNSFKGLEDSRFQHYSTRRFTHLIKMCLLTAASRMSTEINKEDVLFSNTLLSYVEHRMPQALGEFGKAKHADVTARILAYLSTATAPQTPQEIWKQVSSDLDNFAELLKLMNNLLAANKVSWVQPKGGTAGYLIKANRLKTNQIYVDFELLKEYTSTRVR